MGKILKGIILALVVLITVGAVGTGLFLSKPVNGSGSGLPPVIEEITEEPEAEPTEEQNEEQAEEEKPNSHADKKPREEEKKPQEYEDDYIPDYDYRDDSAPDEQEGNGGWDNPEAEDYIEDQGGIDEVPKNQNDEPEAFADKQELTES